MAPGPGRSATPSTAALPVAGMQNTDPSADTCGCPSVRLPAGVPLSWMHCVVACPNAPAAFWPGQKSPVAAVRDAVPLVSGVRSTPNGAWNPVGVGRQSTLVMPSPTATHGFPESGLTPLVFVFQVGSHVPERHFGHGDAVFPLI